MTRTVSLPNCKVIRQTGYVQRVPEKTLGEKAPDARCGDDFGLGGVVEVAGDDKADGFCARARMVVVNLEFISNPTR